MTRPKRKAAGSSEQLLSRASHRRRSRHRDAQTRSCGKREGELDQRKAWQHATGMPTRGTLRLDVAGSRMTFWCDRRQLDIARWRDRRYRVLVDRLARLILEKNDELIERIDLPLELDSVHQENGYGYAVLSQGVEKRLLQILPFCHVLSLFSMGAIRIRSAPQWATSVRYMTLVYRS